VSERRRFPRTLRSQRQRNMLWRSQNGLCARCGEPLDPNDWEADHIEPWRETRRTNVHEMQALHPACNRGKG
jgi:5-methylcytosine-specific restriction endonuclease McrA